MCTPFMAHIVNHLNKQNTPKALEIHSTECWLEISWGIQQNYSTLRSVCNLHIKISYWMERYRRCCNMIWWKTGIPNTQLKNTVNIWNPQLFCFYQLMKIAGGKKKEILKTMIWLQCRHSEVRLSTSKCLCRLNLISVSREVWSFICSPPCHQLYLVYPSSVSLFLLIAVLVTLVENGLEHYVNQILSPL